MKRAMSMQSQSEQETQIELEENFPPRRKMTVENARLKKIQSNFGWAAILIPGCGSLLAVGVLPYTGIAPVAVILLVGMYLATTVGLEIGFHRYFSHRAFQTNKSIRVILAVLGSMAAVGHLIHWVSHHRSHHQDSDGTEDPHSPHLNGKKECFSLFRGLCHAHCGWFFNSEFPNVLLAKDLLRDPLLVKVNRLYLVWVFLGFAIPALLGGILIGTWTGVLQGLLWGGFVRVFLVHHAFWSINSLCHVYGNRPFNTGDRSTNNIWLAIPTMGESWHNNHHAFPNSAIVGLEWWQIDPCGWLIRVLQKLNLVWEVKVPSTVAIASKKAKTA